MGMGVPKKWQADVIWLECAENSIMYSLFYHHGLWLLNVVEHAADDEHCFQFSLKVEVIQCISPAQSWCVKKEERVSSMHCY